MGLLVVLGAVGVMASRGGNRPPTTGPAPGAHWHAPFGINICGQWQPNFETSMAVSGIHSHNDAKIHLEPRSSAEAYTNATVGLLLENAGGAVTAGSIKPPGGSERTNGDTCPGLDDQPARLRWSVDGREQPQGADPSRYVPNDGEVVVLAFLPEKADLGVPPASPGQDGQNSSE